MAPALESSREEEAAETCGPFQGYQGNSERSEMGYCRYICHGSCYYDPTKSHKPENLSYNDILTRFFALNESLVSVQ